MLIQFLIVVVLTIVFSIRWVNRGRKNTPPGPMFFPLVGTLPQIALTNPVTYLALEKLAQKYGDLMSIKMGMVNAVVVSSFEAAHDLCTREDTLDRQCEGIWWDRQLQKNIGIGFSCGDAWVQMRKFCRDSLRHYGFGSREVMQYMVMDELVELVKALDDEREQAPNGRITFKCNYFHKSFSNLMSSMIMGKRFDYDDPELTELLRNEYNFGKNGVLGAGILTAFPFLKYVFPEALGYNTQMDAIRGLQASAKRLLDSRRKDEYKANPRCFADDFLIKIDSEKELPNPLFTEDNFKVVFSDLMQGGTDTTGNYVNFVMLLLTTHPKVQEKMYDEIVNVCGLDKVPSLEKKNQMPYTQAVLHEGLRWGRTIVHGLPRNITKDFEYRGYTFKKNTILMMNFHAIFFNEKYWGDPQVFRPERFINSDGSLNHQKTERIMSFGAGKRNCFGEVVSRDSSFLFVTTLIQKFRFELPPGTNPTLEPMMGIVLGPHPYDAIVSLRNPN